MLNLTIRADYLRVLILAWIALLLSSIGFALYSQHALGMMPCPWCVIQRLMMLISLALSLLMLGSIGLPVAMALPALALGLVQAAGMAASLYQQFVASKDTECVMSLADRILMASGLEHRWPWMFAASNSCAEAAQATFLGIAFPWLSFAVFAIGSLVSLQFIGHCLRALFNPKSLKLKQG
ncbi:MAG: disulfide bond formation protein B [Betaproteobacteria bacterium]|nr:disulfide bond formation protein B [Betaproteobacteria bacterium]NBO45097.1 disulfide bond formation protein B [Betaproteobacteria bacterium]NBP11429.1 disulfide bond formation protein B [Betaproteobacteria bacterium]NBP62367.1 disulfide bond formation protein B [Betaproteobacteria bacterium]NCU99355.1 disulfide bond formation protein B [Betaproteobacteria bacterium]